MDYVDIKHYSQAISVTWSSVFTPASDLVPMQAGSTDTFKATGL